MSHLTPGNVAFRQRFARSRLRNQMQRGGAALIVTVVLGGGVSMGMAALVVDVGQIYVEREELQSGADAAALALAEECATDPGTCAASATTARSLATSNLSSDNQRSLASLNAKDSATTIKRICYKSSPSADPACIDDGLTAVEYAERSKCIGTAPTASAYVEVYTATKTSDNTYVLPATFAKTLTGHTDRQYHACARATWVVDEDEDEDAPAPDLSDAPQQSAAGLGLTISLCEWEAMTEGGYGPTPPSTTNAASFEGTLQFHGTSGASGEDPCSTGPPSGWNAPGGFGWLATPGNDDCQSTVSIDGSVQTSPGTSMPQECEDELDEAVDNFPTALLMPIYDGVTGVGNNTYYHIAGFSSFVVTGWFWGNGNKRASVAPGSTLSACSGSARCVYGYFASPVIPGSTVGIGG